MSLSITSKLVVVSFINFLLLISSSVSAQLKSPASAQLKSQRPLKKLPYLSNLQADKTFPIFTTYAAAMERSSFILDQGYEFRYYIDSLGADFITDTGGDLALGFIKDGQWVYRTEDMFKAPVITLSYPDIVKFEYYPFKDIKVAGTFVVHSSTVALLDLTVLNLAASRTSLTIVPFMRKGIQPFRNITSSGNSFHFSHIENPDSWTRSHDVPFVDSIQNIFLISEKPDATGVFNSEHGESVNYHFESLRNLPAVKPIRGRVLLPGQERMNDGLSSVKMQLFVNNDFSELLTEASPVWGSDLPAVAKNGLYQLEAGLLDKNATSYQLMVQHSGRLMKSVSGSFQDIENKRLNIELEPVALAPRMTSIKIDRNKLTNSIQWSAENAALFSVYKREYPAANFQLIAEKVKGLSYTDQNASSGKQSGYLVIPFSADGKMGMHSGEVNTLPKNSFQTFVSIKGARPLVSNDFKPLVSNDSLGSILAFSKELVLDPGKNTSLRLVRAVAAETDSYNQLYKEAHAALSFDVQRYVDDNESLFANTPEPIFKDEDKIALYHSANNMMRQVFYPPEGKSSYNYYVFSREPTWGWGHGGQVFHESIAMLAYAYVDPVSAMNSQRVYSERQYPNGYINYRTGSYLDEIIEHNGQLTSSAPWYSWLNWEVYTITKDREFLAEMYNSSKKFYRFIVENRDSDQDGLCEWGGEAILESVRDALVAVWDEVGYPTNFESLDLNCMLVMEAKSLEKMAIELGLPDEAKKWKDDHLRRADLINRTFWDEENGFYYNVDKTTHSFTFKTKDDLKRDEIIGFLPLWAGVASKDRAEKLVAKLTDTNQFWRPYGVPTLSAQDLFYNAKGYWNGPVWVQWNYLLMRGLKDYGYHNEARELVDKVADGMISVLKENHNLWEFYSPDEAWGGYHKTYIWAGIINRMMQDVAQQ